MCGIFGFNGSHPVDPTKLRWLAMENEIRGRHSTGVYTEKVDKNKTKTLVKDVITSSDYVDTLEFRQAIAGANLVNAHTRHATVGAVTKENAHPFEFNLGTKVIGAHNGWIFEKVQNELQYEKFGFDKPFIVDSQLLFAVLSKFNGDYNKLAEVQGAIACSYVVPDKYPNYLFLYKQTGRELHVGMSKEGIYYSSAEKPLKLIGCHGVVAVPDASVMILNNGIVVDIVRVTPPLVSLPLSIQRNTFADRLSKSDLEKLGLGDLKSTPSYTPARSGVSTNKAKAPHLVRNFSTTDEDDYVENQFTDQLTMLIDDVRAHVKELVPNVLEFSQSNSYSIPSSELKSCLVLVTLKASTAKKPPLIGWTVYDKEDSTIAGITMLNGVTVLRFSEAECGKEHTIYMHSPMEEETPYTFTITPESSRVMEVTLITPFPQGDKNEPSGYENEYNARNGSPFLWLGRAISTLHLKRSFGGGGILSVDGKNTCSLSEQVESLHSRHEGEQATGGENTAEGGVGHESGASGVHQGAYTAVADSKLPNAKLTAASIRSLLKYEHDNRTYKKDILKLLKGNEYNQTLSLWEPWMRNLLNVKKLLHDAAVLKLHDIELFRNAYSLGVYASRIIRAISIDDYQERQLDEPATVYVYKALAQIESGNYLEDKKKVRT